MTLIFEKKTVEKMKTILRLLEDTLNNHENVEVHIKNLKSQKIYITNQREKFLELGIESSIIGLKEVIHQIEDRHKQKERFSVYTTVSMPNKKQ